MNKKAIIATLRKAEKDFKPKRRMWTEDERKIVRMFYGKVELGVLAQQLGRTPKAIQLMGNSIV